MTRKIASKKKISISQEIKLEAEIGAVKDISKSIINDFKTMRLHGKNPEPEHFYENWVKLNLTSKFPKKYFSTLWKLFIECLFTKKK